MVLAGGTPARGTPIPALEGAFDGRAAHRSFADELFEALDLPGEQTRRLPAGGDVDAALQDSLAELEATIEIPAQRRLPARDQPVTTDVRQAAPAPAAPKPIDLKPIELPRPPPLPPAARPKPRVAARIEPLATHAPPPMLSDAAPPPRVLQVLGEENTIPGLPPAPRSSSSDKVTRPSDLYRLQLEFEDTPARPLPRVAFVPPPPLPPSAKRPPKKGSAPRSADALDDLHELEAIDDLRAMAKALGLDGVGDVSIPSLEGMPVLETTASTAPLPSFPEFEERFANSVETVFPEKRSGHAGAKATRPALSGGKAVSPVIVKIPSRPKVSLEERERARRLYLSAVDLLGKGERAAAVQHLHLAIERDDGIPLYRDLLEHLEGGSAAPRASDAPALTVVGRDGKRSAPRDHWRNARPR